MRRNGKTAVGIDISQERINIAMLKTGKNGLELVKSASAPLPEGAVRDGNIEDASLLSKAIRELKIRSKIRADRAAVSLFARPVVIQILDIPKQMPTNIRQFVQSEVRNCVALPARDVVLDYCAINKRSADKRVLVVAAEEARMLELARVCSRAGFTVETIEPPLLAHLRTVRSKKVSGKSGVNILVAILQGTVLTLCVLKNGFVDFIRTKEFTSSAQEESQDACPAFGKAWDAEVEECQECAEVYPDEYEECKKLTLERGGDSDDLSVWLADELSEVVRFYDIEFPENAGKWEITLFVGSASPPQVDAAQSTAGVEKCLKSKIQTGHLQVRTIEDACLDMSVGGLEAQNGEKPSPVAIGLAAQLLMGQPSDIKINLVPQQVIKAREAKQDVLIAVNVVAATLLLMLLAVSGLAFMIERVTRGSIVNKQVIARQDTDLMLQRHRGLDSQLNVLSTRLKRLAQISQSYNDVNFVELFDDIRNATPGSVMITSISCQDGSRMLVEGLAMSNEAVNLFIGLLERSRIITSVTLLETRKQEGQKGLIIYQLGCTLRNCSGRPENVG
jgi:type IV pilus assembly protein PilM